MRFRIVQIARTRRDGLLEPALDFQPGVNVLVAPPNGGKTTWLQMFNHLLGSDDYPGQAFSPAIVDAYATVRARLQVGAESIEVERRWHESRNTGKIYWNGVALQPAAFQKQLLTTLGLPLLAYPRVDTLGGPVWPALSFRMLFRHLYRQQRFWTDVVDKQPEPELFASLLVFMGLAQSVFTARFREFYRLSAQTDELRQRINLQQFALGFLARLIFGKEAAGQVSPEQKIAAIQYRLDGIARAQDAGSAAGATPEAAYERGRLDKERDILVRALKYARKSAADFSELGALEEVATPLFEDIERARSSPELALAAEELSAGMREYLDHLNELRPGTWRHREANLSFRRNKVVFDVGARRWNQALGGTDSLYYLLAYHYALMRSSGLAGRQVPGLAILDLPAEFAGDDVVAHEKFIVRPFVDLARRQGEAALQLIVAGASFQALEGCHTVRLETRHNT